MYVFIYFIIIYVIIYALNYVIIYRLNIFGHPRRKNFLFIEKNYRIISGRQTAAVDNHSRIIIGVHKKCFGPVEKMKKFEDRSEISIIEITMSCLKVYVWQ